MSLVPKINLASPVAVYLQIKNSIMFAIASGELKPGNQLVPVKELGQKLNVNFNTVSKAYRELEILGLIYTRRGLGCFVKDNANQACQEICRREIVSRLYEVTREAAAAGLSKGEVRTLVTEVFGSDTPPYSDVPAKLLALAKRGAKK